LINRALIIVVISLIEFASADSLLRKGVERQTAEVYSVTSNLQWTVYTPDPHLFSAPEIYYLERTASTFFQERIKESTQFEDQDVVLVDFKLKGQSVNIGNVQSILAAEVKMTYWGKIMNNFSDILPFVVGKNEAEFLLYLLVQEGFFGKTSTSSSVKYEFNGGSELIAESGIDRILIMFMVFLALSSILAITSLSILISSRCCRRNRMRQQDLKITRTEESDVPMSPNGILGANGKSDGSVIIITPQRGIHHEYEDTPMSQDSEITGPRSIYSTTSSKAPLGIVSMNKLRQMMFSPGKPKNSMALYDIDLNDERSLNENSKSDQPNDCTQNNKV